MSRKPLGHRAYGSIPHLPNSRMGLGDHHCAPGQARIATKKARDKHDRIIITEKLDGSCCAVALLNNEILPLTRAGYLAITSPYEQHHLFHEWVLFNENRFRHVLKEGERICGEWILQAHGTRYEIRSYMKEKYDNLFFPFDIMTGTRRLGYFEFVDRISYAFLSVPCLSTLLPLSIEETMSLLNCYKFSHAIDGIEGAVWRVERDGVFDFMVKYVRPDKVDGLYLYNDEPVWNCSPQDLRDSMRAKITNDPQPITGADH